MRQVDYIVVGLGIAGLTFCEQLKAAGKTFVVVDSGNRGATAVAAGVVNPVVLKRFTAAWNSVSFMQAARTFYKGLAQRMKVNFYDEVRIHRIFNNPQEQNDWMVASDLTKLSPFLSSEILQSDNPLVKAPFGLGQVNQGFRISTQQLLNSYRTELQQREGLIEEDFNYEQLIATEDKVEYENISAKKIIFAQGAQVTQNPYFTLDTLIPKKGEYIVFKSPQLKLKSILKGSFFIIPLGNDLYKAGATFVHGDDTLAITENSKQQIQKALLKIIDVPYEVIDQQVGLRPTVKDRRPLLGTINQKSVVFFSGLGTRGVMMAPQLAHQLFEYVEMDVALPADIDIKRYL